MAIRNAEMRGERVSVVDSVLSSNEDVIKEEEEEEEGGCEAQRRLGPAATRHTTQSRNYGE